MQEDETIRTSFEVELVFLALKRQAANIPIYACNLAVPASIKSFLLSKGDKGICKFSWPRDIPRKQFKVIPTETARISRLGNEPLLDLVHIEEISPSEYDPRLNDVSLLPEKVRETLNKKIVEDYKDTCLIQFECYRTPELFFHNDGFHLRWGDKTDSTDWEKKEKTPPNKVRGAGGNVDVTINLFDPYRIELL